MLVKPNSWIDRKHRTQYQTGVHHVLENWQVGRNECHEEALDGDPVHLIIAYVCYDSPRVVQRGDSLNEAEFAKEMSALFYGGDGDDQGNTVTFLDTSQKQYASVATSDLVCGQHLMYCVKKVFCR